MQVHLRYLHRLTFIDDVVTIFFFAEMSLSHLLASQNLNGKILSKIKFFFMLFVALNRMGKNDSNALQRRKEMFTKRVDVMETFKVKFVTKVIVALAVFASDLFITSYICLHRPN